MTDTNSLTMITTADTDVHLIEGEIDLVCLKIERNKWLLTTDGHKVLCDKVVSAWVPSEDEVRGFLDV